MKTARLTARFGRSPNPARDAAAARLARYARSLANDVPTWTLHADPNIAPQVKTWLLRFARQLEQLERVRA